MGGPRREVRRVAVPGVPPGSSETGPDGRRADSSGAGPSKTRRSDRDRSSKSERSALAKRVAPPPLPPEMKKRLEEAGGKSGQIQATLIWNNINDLDLHCIDPNGEEIDYNHKKASGSLGELDVDRNAGGDRTRTPVENIYFPAGAPLGRYRYYVDYYSQHDDVDLTDYTVNVLVEDQRKSFTGKIRKSDGKVLIYDFTLIGLRVAVPAQVVVYPGGRNTMPVRIERDRRNNSRVSLSVAGDLEGLMITEDAVIPGGSESASIDVAAGAALVSASGNFASWRRVNLEKWKRSVRSW